MCQFSLSFSVLFTCFFDPGLLFSLSSPALASPLPWPGLGLGWPEAQLAGWADWKTNSPQAGWKWVVEKEKEKEKERVSER